MIKKAISLGILFLFAGMAVVSTPEDACAKNILKKINDKVEDLIKKDQKKGGSEVKSRDSHESNMKYVKGLYNELLGRNPDPSGIKTWVGGLDEGKFDRAKVRKLIMQSEEYNKRIKKAEKPVSEAGPGESQDLDKFSTIQEKEPQTSSGISNLKDSLKNSPIDATVHSAPQEFKFAPMASGVIEFETAGITHQDNPVCSCGWEYIFFSMFGDNFGRVLLLHAGGKGRMTRYFVQWGKSKEDGAVLRCERATDNLPDWHKWTVKWGGGKIEFYLDQKKIGEEKFEGRPASCIVGGAKPACRSFKGQWRNYVISK